jgi:hypothetical protein
MLAVGTDVLSIFNKALPTITNELKKLKMLDNSNIIFNIEYVKGNTNVIGYKDNFLAIHGLNEIYQVTSPIKKSVSRASREISYDKKFKIMDILIYDKYSDKGRKYRKPKVMANVVIMNNHYPKELTKLCKFFEKISKVSI